MLGNELARAQNDAHPDGWVDVGGNVRFGAIPVCALVLINGQTQFSCDSTGRYDMTVPVDDNGLITVMAFADGFAPFSQIVTPAEAAEFPVEMLLDQNYPSLTVRTAYGPSVTEGRVIIKGTVSFTYPVCALVLANGQHMFSCNESNGEFALDVPFDQDGNITLMVFADGFKPYKIITSVHSTGIWTGTSSDGRKIAALVLDTGEYYYLYGPVGNPYGYAGLLHGDGSATGGHFTSTNGRDFSFEGAGVNSFHMDATALFQNSLNGSITYEINPSNPVTFTSNFESLYSQTPSMVTIVGRFWGTLEGEAGSEDVHLDIVPTGSLFVTGNDGCVGQGFIRPHLSGNVYDVEITFGGYPCALPFQTVSGAGVFEPETEEYFEVLTIMAVNADRTAGAVFSGSR